MSPLAIQKLIYFAHGYYLVRTKRALVKGYFEAWEHGPVHPQLYHCFKSYGRNPIDKLAERVDPVSGEVSVPAAPDDPEAVDAIERIVMEFGSFTPSQLVKLSHATGGPWDKVHRDVCKTPGHGVRITNELISNLYGYHKLTSAKLQMSDEVYEDAPLERYRFL